MRSSCNTGQVWTAFLSLAVLSLASPASVARAGWAPQTSGTTATLYSVQFLDADHGYAVGDAGTVLRTTNGGALWTSVPIPSSFPVRDLSFINAAEGWVCTGDPSGWPEPVISSGQVWQTTDGGTTWTQLNIGTTTSRLGIFFSSSTHGWSSGTHHHHVWPHPSVFRTTDGGATWSGNSTSWAFGWSYGIHFVDAVNGWAVGSDQSMNGYVLHTTNGDTWTQQPVGVVPALYRVHFPDGSAGLVVGDAGTILGTTNGGSSWSPQTSGTASDLRGVASVSSVDGLVCGDNGTILGSSDGGATWTAEDAGTAVFLRGIDAIDSATAWAVGDNGTILRRSGATGIDHDDTVSRVNVIKAFPNPFSRSATLLIPGEVTRTGQTTLTLYDPAGREIGRQTVASGQTTLELRRGGLPRAVYFFRLGRDHAVLATGKVTIE